MICVAFGFINTVPSCETSAGTFSQEAAYAAAHCLS